MRVAFVHDYLTQFGGAERVLLEMQPMYPQAPVYTALYDPAAFEGRLANIDVRTSFLQHIPGAKRNFRALLPLYPRAFESFDLRGFDLIISSTSSFAKGVRVAPGALHVSYVNTPTRFLWYPKEYAMELTPRVARPALALVTPWLRRWDFAAAQRPHYLIANSHNVAQRIQQIYRRTSDVLHCPVEAEAFAGQAPVGDYYLVMSRLLPYKRIALAIEACQRIGARLIIAGTGPDERRLRALSSARIEFAGLVNDEQRRRLIGSARALVVPGIEDFGLVALEAAAAGRPVVAFGAGGSLETVVEGETGLFFREPDARSLAQTLQTLEQSPFDRSRMQMHARRFAPEMFRTKFTALIERYLHEFHSRAAEVRA
ncbi:MAG: glycosyltransferase [Candidatus Eremiobacteraeota bacterium]|nr:glycosyltransferase [Candidatus Eremiobacteraeota bacterium]